MPLKRFETITFPDGWQVFWSGLHSEALVNGPIHQFLTELINERPEEIVLYIPRSDGIVKSEQARASTEELCITGALCTRLAEVPKNILLMPLDDTMFAIGAAGVFPSSMLIPWASRIPKVFWRGGCSGQENFVRADCVQKLLNNPHADVKLIYRWHHGRGLGSEMFGSPANPADFFQYKYVLILDGAWIASSHMWSFATGAVPLLVTHPANDFWFKRYLRPYENYLPIDFSLSDLEEKLQWLVDHDDEAQKIALGARQLAETVFSSEFQKQYLREELAHLLQSH